MSSAKVDELLSEPSTAMLLRKLDMNQARDGGERECRKAPRYTQYMICMLEVLERMKCPYPLLTKVRSNLLAKQMAALAVSDLARNSPISPTSQLVAHPSSLPFPSSAVSRQISHRLSKAKSKRESSTGAPSVLAKDDSSILGSTFSLPTEETGPDDQQPDLTDLLLLPSRHARQMVKQMPDVKAKSRCGMNSINLTISGLARDLMLHHPPSFSGYKRSLT